METSDDQTVWTLAVEGTLASAAAADPCHLPLEEFPAVAQGRYVRFTAKSYYGVGVGLNYLGWKVYHY